MVEPFHLRVGDRGPAQQTGFTCGSAALTVARMLRDPVFARWVFEGEPAAGGPSAARETGPERFAACERAVMRRTNSIWGPGGRLQVPWPRALGTPTWGALAELEHGAAAEGTRYALHVCRFRSEKALSRLHATAVERVGPGRPALLYVGSAALPRHVTLLVGAQPRSELDVYDPASGLVTALSVEAFTARRLHLAGWDVPWCLVLPR